MQLKRLSEGADDPGDMPTYEYISHVLTLLAGVAPEALRTDIDAMKERFAPLSKPALLSPEALQSALKAISNPDLIDIEHRVARGIKAECGIALGNTDKWPKDTARGKTLPSSVCPGWSNQTNSIFNNRFPYKIDTTGAESWSFDYQVEDGGRITLNGRYPRARYFSFAPYDNLSNSLQQQTDIRINPDTGSVNPWRMQFPSQAIPSFTLNFEFSPGPEKAPPNTSYLSLTKQGKPNSHGTIVYRLYGSDLGDEPNSAGHPLPKITIYGRNGEVKQTFEQCDPYPSPLDIKANDIANFPPLPIPASYAPANPTLSPSLDGSVEADLMVNPDVQFASFAVARRHGQLFVIRAKAWTSPNTRIGEAPSLPADVEGWSLCNYNALAGAAVTCRMDHDIAVDPDGFYTIVVSTPENKPREISAAKGVNWFDWGPYLDNQVVWRFYPRENAKIKAFGQALSGGAASPDLEPFIPKGVYCDKQTFQAGGWEGCLKKSAKSARAAIE